MKRRLLPDVQNFQTIKSLIDRGVGAPVQVQE